MVMQQVQTDSQTKTDFVYKYTGQGDFWQA